MNDARPRPRGEASLVLLEAALWTSMADLIEADPALADDVWQLLSNVQVALEARRKIGRTTVGRQHFQIDADPRMAE